MVRYRNVRTGRVLERPADEWLEASSGWETLEEEPSPKPSGKDKEKDEGSKD